MQAWNKFLAEQEKELGYQAVQKWLRPLKIINFDACNLYLEAKDPFQIMWFEEHIRSKVLHHLLNNNNKRIQVHLKLPNQKKVFKKKEKSKKKEDEKPKFRITFDPLDPLCTFENFTLKEQMAYKLLSEIDLCQFNPIYIYGRPGMGKTHLLMATAKLLTEQGLKALYVRSETFTNHVVNAIRSSEMSVFRQAYRTNDVLIIDDVHVFSKKGATQEELFHTFNTLHMGGKQIILSSNCTPSELKSIEPRLVSRFEWGIVLPLDKMSKEDRRNLLKMKCNVLKFPLNGRALDFIIDHFQTITMIKAVQALILRAPQHITSTQLTVATIKHLLRDLLEEEKRTAITSNTIISSVAGQFGITIEEILSKSQNRDCVLPRQIAMHLCRKILNVPYMKIGELFSRDHSTVMSSVKRIEKGIESKDELIIYTVNTINKKLTG